MNIYKWVKRNTVVGYKCDVCGEKMYTASITLSFGYGHDFDGAEYHFCNYRCLLKFILGELGKEKSEDLEFGRIKSERMDYLEKGAKIGKSRTKPKEK